MRQSSKCLSSGLLTYLGGGGGKMSFVGHVHINPSRSTGDASYTHKYTKGKLAPSIKSTFAVRNTHFELCISIRKSFPPPSFPSSW